MPDPNLDPHLDPVSFILVLIKIECFEIIENGLRVELRVKQERIQNIDLHPFILLYNFSNLRCQIIGEGHGELVAYRKKCQGLISA